MKVIGSNAFYGCSTLANVTIPNTVTTIGDQAFASCSGFTSITIPDSVTTIGYRAFNGCRNATSIRIGCGVTHIESNAFGGCNAVKGVYISDVAAWCEIVFDNAYSNPLYYSRTLYVNDVKITDLIIPEGATVITNSAFGYCDSIVNVVIPNGVTSIGDQAFACCHNLRSVIIPSSVKAIDKDAFYFNDCLTLYCEATEASPEWEKGWDTNGVGDNYSVIWGYTVK